MMNQQSYSAFTYETVQKENSLNFRYIQILVKEYT